MRIYIAGLILFLCTARHPKSALSEFLGTILSDSSRKPVFNLAHGQNAILFCLIFLPILGFACILVSIFLRMKYREHPDNIELVLAGCQFWLVAAPYWYVFKTTAIYYTSSVDKALCIGNALSPAWIFFVLACEAALAYALVEVVEKAALHIPHEHK